MSWFTTENPTAAPDRLDDYRAWDVVAKATLRPLLEVPHDAPADVKELAVRAADEAMRAAAHRHPRVLQLAGGMP